MLDAKVPTLVYLHGNAGNIGMRLTNARQMQLAIGCNVLLVDYRGYTRTKHENSTHSTIIGTNIGRKGETEVFFLFLHPFLYIYIYELLDCLCAGCCVLQPIPSSP